MARHIYYADLNCPFCYALHERIHSEQLSDLVHWRGICHLDSSEAGTLPRERLALAVQAVRRRSPGLTLRVPDRLFDSRPATLTVIQLSLTSEPAAAALRRALYSAVWVDGRDISDKATIVKLCGEVGIDVPVVDRQAEAQAGAWKHEWEHGGFQRRLPVLISPSGASSIGLDDARRTVLFLKAGVLSSVSADHCVASSQEIEL